MHGKPAKAARGGAGVNALWLCVAAAAIALFVGMAVIFLVPASFASVDEAFLSQALAGAFADRPMVWVPYLSPVLCRVLNLLYRFVPGVSWYAWAQRLLILFSMAVINFCVFRQAGKRRGIVAFALTAGACALVDILLCWTTVCLNMVHPAVLTGAAALSLIYTFWDEKRVSPISGVFVFLLFFFCVSYAFPVGVVVFCASLLLAIFRLKPQKGRGFGLKRARMAACVLLAMLVVAAGTFAASRYEQNRLCDDDYAEWQALRTAWLEGAPESREASPAFSRAGWSEDYADLAIKGFLMDREFDARSASIILGTDRFGGSASWSALVSAAGGAMSETHSTGQVLALAVLLHGTGALAVILLMIRGQRARKALLPLGCIAFSDIIFLVLHARGNLHYESAFVFGAPCVVLALLCLVGAVSDGVPALREDIRSSDDLWNRRGGLVLLAAAGVIVLACGIEMYSFNNVMGLIGGVGVGQEAEAEEEEDTRLPTLLETIAENPDSLYICDSVAMAQSVPVQSMEIGALCNLFCWDQAYRGCYPFNEQLMRDGLKSRFTSSDLANDNVWFVASSEETLRQMLRHLSDRDGIHACAVWARLRGGLWLAKYYREYDTESRLQLKDAPLRLMVCEEEDITDYAAVTPGTNAGLPAQWVAADSFEINYHLRLGAPADEQRTRVEYGKLTPTLTLEELGFVNPDHRFMGWRIWRDDERSWMMQDKNGLYVWGKTLEGGRRFAVYPDGMALSEMVQPGVVLHFYGQWDPTTTYDIVYHRNMNDSDSKKTTTVQAGTAASALTTGEMGFFKAGERFLGWRAFRTDTQCWDVVNATGERKWAANPFREGNYCLYEEGSELPDDISAGYELQLYAQWEETDSFTVYYHPDDDSEADARTTEVVYGVSTPTLTPGELGFIRRGLRFTGWKMWRSDTDCWLVTNARGDDSWRQKVPFGGDYMQWREGHVVAQAIPAGAELHLYAQWEKTDAFAVRYHPDDDSPASGRITEVRPGTATLTLTPEELGFQRENGVFAGWRMVRGTDGAQGVVYANGRTGWKKKVPKGGSLWLYQAGWALSEAVPPGYELHLYAQWKDADSFTVYYHPDDASEAAALTTEVVYGVSTPTLTLSELGFDGGGRAFTGWKVRRSDNNRWLVTNAGGKGAWSEKVPAGEAYLLWEEGRAVSKAVHVGYELHLYAQWENTFTVHYHVDESAPPSGVTTRVESGVGARAMSLARLGFSDSGERFAGWKAVLSGDGSVLMENADGKRTWMNKPEAGWTEARLEDGASLKDLAPPGAEVHLYGMWQ